MEVKRNMNIKHPSGKQRTLIENIALCEKIMAQMMLKEKQASSGYTNLAQRGGLHRLSVGSKSHQNVNSNCLQSVDQKKHDTESKNLSQKKTSRQCLSERSLPKSFSNAKKRSAQENISLLLSHILTDGSYNSEGQDEPVHLHISTEVPEQPLIHKHNIPINLNSEQNDEPIQQEPASRFLDCAVQTVKEPSNPLLKLSKSVQFTTDEPTTNSIGIDCNILSLSSSRDDISSLLDEKNNLSLSKNNRLKTCSRHCHPSNIKSELDKVRLNWLQKENQFNVEKERFHKKLSAVLAAKDQAAKNLETSREYIKLLKDRMSMLEQSQSDVRPFSQYPKHSSPERCESFSTDSAYSQVHLKHISSLRSTPDLSATLPTLSKLLLLGNEYRESHKCMAAASQSPAKNCLINQSCQTEWDDQHYWSDRLQSSNNHDNSFESDCFSAHSIPVSSNNERKSTTEHKDTTQQSHYNVPLFPV
ncbi:unnamed protein product [Heterobilharzia americana]|nr:unnamed protein product [Heterobilharzia americana]